MKLKKLFLNLIHHLVLALCMYLNQIMVNYAYAEQKDERSERQKQTIENSKENKQNDINKNELSLTSCSNTNEIKDLVKRQKVKFNQAYFNQFKQAQYEVREEINKQTKELYGTFAFVGNHAGSFGTETRSATEIQNDIDKEQDKLAKLNGNLTAAQSEYNHCIQQPLSDPTCAVEKLKVRTIKNNIEVTKTALGTYSKTLVISNDLTNNSTGVSSSDQYADAEGTFEQSKRDLTVKENILNDAIRNQNMCMSSPCPTADQQQQIDTAQSAVNLAEIETMRAKAAMEQAGAEAEAKSKEARNQNLSSDIDASTLSGLYKSYINSLDDFISEAKKVERNALKEYEDSQFLNKDNSEYDLFDAIMSDYDNESDKIINKKILFKSMAMMATASSAVSNLACTEIKTIAGIGSTTPFGENTPFVPVTSIKLFRAASAMYLTSQINSTAVYDDAVGGCILKCEPIVNTQTYDPGESLKKQVTSFMGVNRTPECFHKSTDGKKYPGYYSQDKNANEDKDEQIASIERAANTYQKLVETALMKRVSLEDSLDMYQKAWEVSLEEWRDKITRVSGAQAQLAQARAMVKSTEENIKSALIAEAILAISTYVCCSNPWCGATACGFLKFALVALGIYILLLRGDLNKYEGTEYKWEKELKRAQTHAQLDCNFPGWEKSYNTWNKSKATNSSISSGVLGEVSYFRPKPIDKNENNIFNLFETIPNRIAKHIKAPICNPKDMEIAKSLLNKGGKNILNFFLPNAFAQTGITNSDKYDGNALGIRGKDDVANKNDSASTVDTTLFKLYLAQKLSALKIQTYNPLDDGIFDLKESPVRTDHLVPQDNTELSLYLYNLVASNKINKATALTFAPTTNDQVTHTGFPQVETRHFYIQSVIFQLQDLIAELNMALGSNCGVITMAGANMDLNLNPDKKETDGSTSSSLCGQRNYYVSLLRKAKSRMKLDVTGLDSDAIDLPKLKKGACIKQASNGEIIVDKKCECKTKNSCLKFEVPKFANINTSVKKEAKIVISATNESLSGNTEKADILKAELSKGSNATRGRINELKSEISSFDKLKSSLNNIEESSSLNGSNTKGKVAAYVKTNAPSKGKGFTGRNSNTSQNSAGSTDRILNNNKADISKISKTKDQEENSKLEAKGLKPKTRIDGSLDFDFDTEELEENGISLTNSKTNPLLLQIAEQEGDEQDLINSSFNKLNFKERRREKRGKSIHSNSQLSLFKIISKRYKTTAYPVLLETNSGRK